MSSGRKWVYGTRAMESMRSESRQMVSCRMSGFDEGTMILWSKAIISLFCEYMKLPSASISA